jgi:hypothetical protein
MDPGYMPILGVGDGGDQQRDGRDVDAATYEEEDSKPAAVAR